MSLTFTDTKTGKITWALENGVRIIRYPATGGLKIIGLAGESILLGRIQAQELGEALSEAAWM